MKKIKISNKYLTIFLASILLFSLITYFFFSNIHKSKLLNEKPTDIVVANITTVTADIYWKADMDTVHRIFYKESSDTGVFKKMEDFYIFRDETTKERLFLTNLTGLEPNTEYQFRIESENKVWDIQSFKTKNIAEELDLPTIATGNNSEQTFLLIDIDGDKYMLDTQYHGTWALDSKNKEYTVSKYATYIPKNDLASKLNNLLASPIYAQSGANCKLGVKIKNNSPKPLKADVIRIIDGWVGNCKLAGYPECYEDLYCRSLSSGVNPAFAFSVWTQESGGSNYANNSKVEDFGIHGLSTVPVANFDKQANHFLNNIAGNADSYISGCTGNKLYAWGAKFWTGKCSNLDKGQEYISYISRNYSWYTNETLTWPFTVSKNSSACDYSSAYTNTTYNSCGSKGTPTTPPSDPTTPPPPGGDGAKDYMIVTGTGVTPKDRDCKDPDGCICLYGYTNSKASSTLTIKNGYTCTVDKKVIETPERTKVCCYANNTVSYVSSSKCEGTTLEGITEKNCKIENRTVSVKKGVNFIEVPYYVNRDQIPIVTARALITYSGNKIIAVGLFRNDRWEKIVKNENGSINGQDFNLDPGESYLVIATEDIDIPLMVVGYNNPLKLDSLKGWNLVPTSLFGNVSSDSKGILQNTSYTFINQVAVWNNSLSIFDYTLRDTSGQIYGDSLQMPTHGGFFIKIPR